MTTRERMRQALNACAQNYVHTATLPDGRVLEARTVAEWSALCAQLRATGVQWVITGGYRDEHVGRA